MSVANQAHGYATPVVARKLKIRRVRAERDRHEHEHGRHGHEIYERDKEENVVGIGTTTL